VNQQLWSFFYANRTFHPAGGRPGVSILRCVQLVPSTANKTLLGVARHAAVAAISDAKRDRLARNAWRGVIFAE
jgi:hypothetical protein